MTPVAPPFRFTLALGALPRLALSAVRCSTHLAGAVSGEAGDRGRDSPGDRAGDRAYRRKTG